MRLEAYAGRVGRAVQDRGADPAPADAALPRPAEAEGAGVPAEDAIEGALSRPVRGEEQPSMAIVRGRPSMAIPRSAEQEDVDGQPSAPEDPGDADIDDNEDTEMGLVDLDVEDEISMLMVDQVVVVGKAYKREPRRIYKHPVSKI